MAVPQNHIGGLTFWPIPEFTDVEISFGAPRKAFFDRSQLPEVPRKYLDMTSSLFFNGGMVGGFNSKVDSSLAWRALRAWLCSFDPAHESKEATVAYALWVWTEGDLD